MMVTAFATGAQAQAVCKESMSAGSPPVDRKLLFCGDIDPTGKAIGFHARPWGVNPPTVTNVSEPHEIPEAPGLYRLLDFDIAANQKTAHKVRSTMFPDDCSKDNIVEAIQHAYNTGKRNPDGRFTGMSGPGCTAGFGLEFKITGYTSTAGGLHIGIVYPVP